MREQISIIKKYIPEKMKNGSIIVPLSPLDPILFVYADLYYKDYLHLIYYLGRGYMFVQHVIYYSIKQKTTVMKDLREMEKLNLIIITKVNKNLYVRLSRYGIMYITQNENEQSYKPATEFALLKSAFICELQKNILDDDLILKKELNYKYFLWFLSEKVNKGKVYDEIKRIESNEYGNKYKDYKDLIELEQHLNIYLTHYGINKRRITLDFSICDVFSSLDAKGIIRGIKEINNFLNEITGIDMYINNMFEININLCTLNKCRSEMIYKSLVELENYIISIDNLQYSLANFPSIKAFRVTDLSIDRFFM